jgi:hypothetical protein
MTQSERYDYLGALYVRNGIKLERQQHGAGQEGGLRAGTESVLLVRLILNRFRLNTTHSLIDSSIYLFIYLFIHSFIHKK